MRNYFCFILLLLTVIGCQKDDKLSNLNPEKVSLFTKLTLSETGVKFKNELPEGIKFNGLLYEYYYNGSGLAVIDFNNDGLKDIFFVSALKQHKLFLNQGNLKFLDVSRLTGILRHQHFSGGIAVIDINNDGWMDIYISNSGKFKSDEKRKNKLYINQGARGKQKIPTFKEESKKYGLDISACSTQATFFDYDKDGDLDMYLLNHHPLSYPNKETADLLKMDGGLANDRLLRNDDNYFTDVSKQAGISQTRLEYGLGVGIGDMNNDGWPDIYVSTDFDGSDHLYLNNQDGTFSDKIIASTNHTSFFSMGNDIGDVNNDGWLDFMSVDMRGASNYDIKTSMSGMNPKSFQEVVNLGLHHQYMYNTLQINSGYLTETNIPHFYDIAQFAGVAKTDWSWAPLFFDMDNDGFKDIFVSNGIKRDFRNNDFLDYVNRKQDSIHLNKSFKPKKYIADVLQKMPERKKENYLFRNQGNLRFLKMNAVWGDAQPTSSNGVVYADLDNDGDLEIIVNNTDDFAFILKNNAIELGLGYYLSVKLKGSPKNRYGIGTRINLITSDGIQTQELYNTRGFMSAVSNEIHFGLGNTKKVTIEVIWPDLKKQIIRNVNANQLLTVDYNNAQTLTENKNPLNTLFTKEHIKGLKIKHQENYFDDFEREGLLPHKMSQEGPALAIGDINGDGLDDIHIGNALGKEGKILQQQKDGSFLESNISIMKKDAIYEDTFSSFIDIDGDKDLDLYIVSGGNEHTKDSPLLRDRLYLNDGKGNFSNSSTALPNIAVSGSCVKAADYDKDGDLDLFIGGRQIPGRYPNPAKSYILVNKSVGSKIHFDILDSPISIQFDTLGMVTDAIWIDINKDKYLDIVVTGEWMPIMVFENTKNGDFKDKTVEYGFKNTNGWWYCLSAADFDKDGDLDIIAGNLGLNYKYKASQEKPFEVFASDFDKTGTYDIVLSYYDKNILMPLRGRECSSNQMPFIKKKFPTYDAFAKAKLRDVFDKNQLEKSVHLKAYTFSTSMFINEEGHFKKQALPDASQLSSVNDILIEDFNQDSNMDIIMAGNLYNSEVETPRNDASYGVILLGNGNGGFNELPNAKSGLMLRGEVRHIKHITIKGSKKIVVIKNNDSLKVLKKSVSVIVDF